MIERFLRFIARHSDYYFWSLGWITAILFKDVTFLVAILFSVVSFVVLKEIKRRYS